MPVTGLDHLVMTVSNVEATCAFYDHLPGVDPVTFDGGRRGLAMGDQKINLHQSGAEYDPHAANPAVGADDFCLVWEGDIKEAQAVLDEAGVEIRHGPVEKVGALGPMTSVYVRDPDGNLVELATYGE